MLFDPNQTVFSCDYQRKIWQLGVHVIPPSVSLIDVTEPEIKEGCMQVYDCTIEMLSDMYYKPEEYETMNPRWFICDYFIWMIHGGVQIKHRENYKRFLQIIPRFGFVYDQDLNFVTNERYPLFIAYLDKLATLSKQRKQNMGNYLTHRDFRLFANKVILSDEDLFRPLSDEYQKFFRELHTYAKLKGVKIERKDPCVFRYTYNKLFILILNNNPMHIEVPYRLDNGKHIPGQFERFIEVAESQTDNDELISYIQKNIGICDGCRYRDEGRKTINERCGQWVNIRGVRRLASMCHASISKYHRGKGYSVYTIEDITLLKRMIDIRVEQIDNFIKDGV